MTERDINGNILSTSDLAARAHTRAARANHLEANRVACNARDAAMADGASEIEARAIGDRAREKWWEE